MKQRSRLSIAAATLVSGFASVLVPALALAQNAQTFVTFCNRTPSALQVDYTLDGDTQPNRLDVPNNGCRSESLTTYQGTIRVHAGASAHESQVTVSPGTRTLVSIEANCGNVRRTRTSICLIPR